MTFDRLASKREVSCLRSYNLSRQSMSKALMHSQFKSSIQLSLMWQTTWLSLPQSTAARAVNKINSTRSSPLQIALESLRQFNPILPIQQPVNNWQALLFGLILSNLAIKSRASSQTWSKLRLVKRKRRASSSLIHTFQKRKKKKLCTKTYFRINRLQKLLQFQRQWSEATRGKKLQKEISKAWNI